MASTIGSTANAIFNVSIFNVVREQHRGAALVAPAATATAGVIYDNLTPVNGGTASVSFLDHGPLADSFSTGATAAKLTDVKLLLLADTPTDGGAYTVSLLADSATSPGTLVAALGARPDSSLGAHVGVVDFALASPVALTGATRYWIEVTGGATSAEWGYDAANTGLGTANEYNDYAGVVYANNAFTPYQMQVTANGAAVPEPGAWMLLLAGVAGVGLTIRRSRGRAIPA